MKIKHLLFIIAFIFLGWQQLSAGNPGGNLIISATGTSSTLPIGDFMTGIGERGHDYTLTAADLTTMITNANGQLTLTFDNITISGNVVLNLSGCNRNINLTLLTDKYASGTIRVANGGGLSIITATNKTSEITLLAGNMTGVTNIKADKVTIADRMMKYDRIYMPGFTNWTQTQINNLIATASHIGPSITDLGGGYKMYDFTTNTQFTVANGVFTMTAQADFTGTKGMGFKNMDRDGTLAGQALGAYPANFFNDLTNAEGIRFKVDVKNGTAGTLNIGLSNCATAMFEYFINGIPLTAADEDGYITLPLSLFKKEFWSNEGLQLNNCKVFIIEIIDVTNGTSVSFSDFHAYKTGTAANQSLTLGGVALDENAKEVNIVSTKGITQHNGQTFSAKGNINIDAEDKVTMNNDGNSLLGNINIKSKSISLTTKNTESSAQAANFTFTPINSLVIYNVLVDGQDKGKVSTYNLNMTDNKTHTVEVIMASRIDTTITIKGSTQMCEGADNILTASGKADSYVWYHGSEVLSNESQWQVPSTFAEGEYPIHIVGSWYDSDNDVTIHFSKDITLSVYAASETALSDSIIYGNSYKKNGFNITPTEVGTSEHTLTLTNAHGCDSIVTLTLKTLPIPIDTTLIVSPTGDISLCEGNATSLIATSTANQYEWYLNGDKVSSDEICDIPNNLKPNDYTIRLVATWTPDGSPATTLTREIALRINRVDLVNIKDTVILGETYKKNGFDITPTETGDTEHKLTLTNAFGCDSTVTLTLTTLPVPIDTNITIEGETEICEGTSTTLTAISSADDYAWFCDEQQLSDGSSVVIPDTMVAGKYTIELIAMWHGEFYYPENVITVTKTFELTINKTDKVEISDTVNVGETYNKNGFDVTPTEAGTTDHTLTLTNANGCDSVVVLHLTAIIPEGIHDFDIVRSIYPNPTTNYVTVHVSGQAMGSELRLYDMQGRLMKAQIIDNETVRIDLTSFANGVYLLKADSQTVKIIKH
jgi:hypothetical protein